MRHEVGQKVETMYFHPRHGTCLGAGTVVGIERRDDGKYVLSVQPDDPTIPVQTYTMSKSGRSDYVI